jgi:hypothetical protein
LSPGLMAFTSKTDRNASAMPRRRAALASIK